MDNNIKKCRKNNPGQIAFTGIWVRCLDLRIGNEPNPENEKGFEGTYTFKPLHFIQTQLTRLQAQQQAALHT
jgi:hypothetical protein